MARPFVDDALQHPAYYSRGLLAYHPGARDRGSLLLGHVGRDPLPPVGDGCVARHELQRGNREALPHGDVPDSGAAPVLISGDDTSVFSPHVHACRLPETEAPDVLLELRAPELACYLDRAHVARLLEDVARGHDLGLVRLGVVDHAVGDGNVVGDDEGRVCGYGALLDGGCYGKALKVDPGSYGSVRTRLRWSSREASSKLLLS